MVNQSVNKFYTHFLFKINSLPQDFILPLEITTNLFNNLSPDVRNILISEGVQVTPRLPTENNNQVNKRLLLVRNEAVEAKNKTRTIKAAVQTASRRRHTMKFTVMIGVKH